MKSLLFTGITVSAIVAASPAAMASDSFTGSASSKIASAIEGNVQGMKKGSHGMRGHHGMRRMHGGRIRHGGFRGGFIGFYRRPSYGFILPTYWRAPSFAIQNYSTFGLSAPVNGYHWSRYYDDAVLRNDAGRVYDYRQNVDWSQGGNAYAPNGYYNQQTVSGPAIQADSGVYGVNSGTAYNSAAPEGTTQTGQYDGQWTGQYIDEANRTYQGEWQGRYTNEDGQVYQGTYRGTMVGDPVYTNAGVAPAAPAPVAVAAPAPVAAPVPVQAAPVYTQAHYAPAPVAPAPAYQTPAGFESYERCLKGRGVAGGAIGAIIGAVAGNRIAGRGDRLAGSLIGGGIGAIGGSLIEKATNRCERFLPKPVAQPQYRPAPRPQYVQQQPHGYGWSHGYYYVPGGYYYPPAQTVVTVTPGQTTTTTVVEEYEEVQVAHKGKRLVKPAYKRLRKPGY